MPLPVELKILDPRLPGWGFPRYGSECAAGLDLHACIDGPLLLEPQAPPVLISAGIAFRIADPDWCALVLPRSGLGHREGAGARQRGRADRPRLHGHLPDLGLEPQSGTTRRG